MKAAQTIKSVVIDSNLRPCCSSLPGCLLTYKLEPPGSWLDLTFSYSGLHSQTLLFTLKPAFTFRTYYIIHLFAGFL